MPLSSSIADYPTECGDVFRRAVLAPLKIVCTSFDQARSWRHRLYAFRRAYRTQGSEAFLYLMLDTISITQEKNILTLNIKNHYKPQQEFADALKDATKSSL